MLVGRQSELAILHEGWRECRRRHPQLIGVAGDSGLGKTSLVRRFLDEAGAAVITVDGAEEQFAGSWTVWRQLLTTLRRLNSADSPVELDDQAAPAYVGEALAELLRSSGELIVVIDDAHVADEASMAALRIAIRRLETAPVLILVVYQDSGTLLNDDWKRVFESYGFATLRPAPFSTEDIMELALALDRPALTPDAASYLRQYTDGNPQHCSLLLEYVETHSIVFGLGPLPAGRGIGGAIVSRFGSCGTATRALLSAGAVLGRRFTITDACAIADVSDPAQAVTEATSAGFVEEVPGTAGQTLMFVTRLIQDCVYEDLGKNRRRRIDLHLAAAELGGTGTLWHRIAAAAGRPDDDVAAAVEREARFHLSQGRLRLAAAYAHRALDLTPRGPLREPRLLFAVEALLVAGDVSTARHYEEEVVVGGGPWRDYVAGYQALLGARVGEAKRLLRRALDTVGTAPPDAIGAPADLRARIAAQLSIIAVVELSYDEMIKFGDEAVSAPTEERWVQAFAWLARSLGRALSGHGERTLVELADADLPNSAAGLDGLVARGIIRLWTDDLAGAQADLEESIDRAKKGEPLRVGQALGFLGEVEYRRGDLERSVYYTRLAVGDAEANNRIWDFALVHSLACYPRAARGEWPQALHHANKAARSVTDIDTILDSPVSRTYAAGARAAIAQAQDHRKRLLVAATEIESLYDSLEPGTHLFGPLRADALSRLDRVDEAAEALEAFQERIASPHRRSARMSMGRVRGQIAQARGDHEHAESEYKQALELARECEMPLEAARIELRLADCSHARGRRPAAIRSLHSALEGFTRMGAAAYVEQVREMARNLKIDLDLDAYSTAMEVLTRREREVAKAALDASTYQDVADKLGISIKTVGTHMSNIYLKLNISTWGELRRILSGER